MKHRRQVRASNASSPPSSLPQPDAGTADALWDALDAGRLRTKHSTSFTDQVAQSAQWLISSAARRVYFRACIRGARPLVVWILCNLAYTNIRRPCVARLALVRPCPIAHPGMGRASALIMGQPSTADLEVSIGYTIDFYVHFIPRRCHPIGAQFEPAMAGRFQSLYSFAPGVGINTCLAVMTISLR